MRESLTKAFKHVKERVERVGDRSLLTRGLVARQVKLLRGEVEQKGGYKFDRGAFAYKELLSGIKHLLKYISELEESSLVVDVGAGTSRAINELSQQDEIASLGLTFKATGLKWNDQVDQHIGRENYILTSAEVMRGFDNSSVAGILGVHSISYSQAPDMVVNRFDELLIPGGVIKALVRNEGTKPTPLEKRTRMQSATVFEKSLKGFGYDVSIMPHHYDKKYAILLAIKPGGKVERSAGKLLYDDANDWIDKDRISEILSHLPASYFEPDDDFEVEIDLTDASSKRVSDIQ